MIHRNEATPYIFEKLFTTKYNNQTAINFLIYEVEDPVAEKNVYLGKIRLSGLKRAAKGVPKVNVKFVIDRSGCLTVSARDEKT